MKILHYILFSLLLILVRIPAAEAQDEVDIDSIKTILQSLEGEAHFRLLIELSDNENLEADTRIQYADDAVKYAQDLDRTELISEAYINLGNLQHQRNFYEEAIQAFDRAYQASNEGDYPEGMADAMARTGRAYIYLGEQDKAEEYLQQGHEMAVEIRDLTIEARSVYWMGDLQRRQVGDLEAAIERYEEALPLAREAEDQLLEANILADHGLVLYMLGNFSGAIEYFGLASPLLRMDENKFGEARIFVLLANANIQLARFDVALTHYQEALPIFEEISSTAGIAAVLNGMAVIYLSQNLYEKALEMHFQKLEFSRSIENEEEIGNTLNNIGNTYSEMAVDTLSKMFGENFIDSLKIESSDKYLDFFTDAIDYYQQALEVWERIDNKAQVAGTLYNLGLTYLNSGMPNQALEYFERASVLNQEVNNQHMQADLYLRMGQVSLSNGDLIEANQYLHQSLNIALELDTKKTLEYVYLNLAELNSKLKNFEQALVYFRSYAAVKDTLNQKERMDMISEMQVKYETEATEKENALLTVQTELAEYELRQTKIILIITIIAIGVFLVMVVQLIRQNNLKKKANRELAESNALITHQKKEITDSIEYASRIQNAMLPPGDYVDNLLPERFIIYMPRDIVSGDYYYITEKDDKVICVAADCTGHGVPGAFMSMLGIAFLNEIISKHTELHTDQMLNELRAHVIKNLHQTGKEGESQDGMDLALYIADLQKMTIEFSGANNSLLVFRNGKMIEAKADKMPIGIHTRANESFTRHNMDLHKGDMIYTFSDGYPDQFGGPKQKKFMIKNFKALLGEINQKSMEEQRHTLEAVLADWMADTEQVDDILIIGVRV